VKAVAVEAAAVMEEKQICGILHAVLGSCDWSMQLCGHMLWLSQWLIVAIALWIVAFAVIDYCCWVMDVWLSQLQLLIVAVTVVGVAVALSLIVAVVVMDCGCCGRGLWLLRSWIVAVAVVWSWICGYCSCYY